MSIKTHIGRLLRQKESISYFLLAALTGAMPAICIRLRGRIIDIAGHGSADGAGGFFIPLLLFCLLFLLETACSAGMTRLLERQKIRRSTQLDSIRLEKASKTAFPVTETQPFHSLWQKAAEAPALDHQIHRSIGDMLHLSVNLALSLFVLSTMDIWVAAGIVVLLALGILLSRRMARKTDGFWVKYRENMRQANYFSSLLMQRDYAAERKLFSFDEEIDRRYQTAYSHAKQENGRMGKDRFQTEALMQALFGVYGILLVLLLLRPFLSGKITLGLFISAFYAAIGLEQSSQRLYAAIYDFVSAAHQMESFFSFQNLENEPQTEEKMPVHTIRSIEFRDVTFTYPGMDKPVLKHISFRLEPDHHYALVGENGCGKSTLVKLLTGLYAPDSGAVLINGMPAHELSPADRRRLFCVVFQDFYRYPITIRENVSLCRDVPADDRTMRDVFDRLAFHPAAAGRKEGFDSSLMPLFQTGAGLSGGEWQKMAVARCILSQAPIAILDEPNAALDPMAEARIYGSYRGLLDQKTSLFISHRLGSVRLPDEILVLKEGALIAKAPHPVLMSECAYYAELFNTQKGLYDEQPSN